MSNFPLREMNSKRLDLLSVLPDFFFFFFNQKCVRNISCTVQVIHSHSYPFSTFVTVNLSKWLGLLYIISYSCPHALQWLGILFIIFLTYFHTFEYLSPVPYIHHLLSHFRGVRSPLYHSRDLHSSPRHFLAFRSFLESRQHLLGDCKTHLRDNSAVKSKKAGIPKYSLSSVSYGFVKLQIDINNPDLLY